MGVGLLLAELGDAELGVAVAVVELEAPLVCDKVTDMVAVLDDERVAAAVAESEMLRKTVGELVAKVEGETGWHSSPLPTSPNTISVTVPAGHSRTQEPLPAGRVPLRMTGSGSNPGGSSA